MNTQKDFLSALFDQHEHACFAKDQYGIKTSCIHSSPHHNRVQQFVTLNPLLPGTTRKKVNVAAKRNFLLEYDLELATIESQLEYMDDYFPGLYTTAVHSGGKSVHFIISLEESVTQEEYDRIFWRLQQYEPHLDPMCKDTSRLTRLGGALRSNGNLQEILYVGDRIPQQKLESFLDEKGIQRAPDRTGRRSKPLGDSKGRIHPADAKILNGEEIIQEGERYNKLRGIIARLIVFNIDKTPEDLYNRLEKARELCGYIGKEEDEIIWKSINGAFDKKASGQWS